MASKKYTYDLTLLENNSFAASPRLSNLRRSIHGRTRTSLVSQYSTHFNSGVNVSDNKIDKLDQDEALGIFLNNPLSNICRVSPLHNFKYNKIKFKQYGSKIQQHIAANVNTNTNIQYSVEINVIENLKLEKQHSDAFKVSVWGSKGDSDDNVKLIYRGVFFSWGFFASREEPNVTHLPLLLDYGQARVAAAVREMIMKLFDCVVTQLSFTQPELLLFGALISSFAPFHGAKPVTFTYKVPRTKFATKIEISMEADEIHKLWMRCFPKDDEPIVYGQRSSRDLYALFQEHVKLYYDIDVAHFELTHLNYPNIRLQSKGILKLNDLETSKAVLRILGEMSVILKGTVPKLASDY